MQKENRQYEAMLQVARARLCGRNAEKIAAQAGAELCEEGFRLQSLGKEVLVKIPGLELEPECSMWHTLTLLHYLDLADGTEQSGQLMTFSQYPEGGLVRGGGFDREAENLIAQKLGALPPAELEARCRALGGEILPGNADLCVRFDFLPRYPVWLKVWFADEEFPASGRMFLDKSAPHYLTIEDAVTVGSLILDNLTGEKKWTCGLPKERSDEKLRKGR